MSISARFRAPVAAVSRMGMSTAVPPVVWVGIGGLRLGSKPGGSWKGRADVMRPAPGEMRYSREEPNCRGLL